MNRASLFAALPPAAQSMCDFEYIDAADAFLAWADGLNEAQARSRARNAARAGGWSWPDRVDFCSVALAESKHSSGLYGADPALLIEAIEAASAALACPKAKADLHRADLRNMDTRQASDMFRLTQRRVQQLKAQRLALAQAGQLSLLEG
jgi:hypothetical protein